MKIEVSRITDKEVVLEEDIPAAQWDLDRADVSFVDNIHLRSVFVKAGKEALVKTTVTTHSDIICSRCLKQAHQTHQHQLIQSYPLNQIKDYLDIDEDIREEILLQYPMKVLCKADCKGLCPHCGVDLNEQTCSCGI